MNNAADSGPIGIQKMIHNPGDPGKAGFSRKRTNFSVFCVFLAWLKYAH